ncbi:MAG: restriction endonuclease subunit S [Bacteroidetes bacterium]|nr:restriction endonuclease subunit S [Bacteroidota bacterium]
MKKGWEIKKLGDVCVFKSGTTIDSKLEKEEGEIIYAKVGDMNLDGNEDYINRSSRYVDSIMINKNQLIPIGSIIFPKRGGAIATNKKRRIAHPTIVDLNTMALVPNKNINKDYLYFWFQQIDLSDLSNGTSIPQINNYSFDNVYISYPHSLNEQQRIVSILNEAFAAIEQAKANAARNLQNARELFESYLEGVFENGNWEEKKLQDVAKVFERGKSRHRPRNWEGLYGGQIPFIQTGDVRNANKYITNYTQTYNEVGLAQSKLWKKGTICITIAANIAETAILNFDACIPDSIIGFYVNDNKADLNFAYYLLQYFKAELQKLGKGSAQDNINLGTFENRYFPFPPLKEQQTIVRQLDALRDEMQKLESVYQKKIDYLEELKKSLLQKAFSGAL